MRASVAAAAVEEVVAVAAGRVEGVDLIRAGLAVAAPAVVDVEGRGFPRGWPRAGSGR